VLLAGCSTIVIKNSDGDITVKRKFGIVSLEIQPKDEVVVVEASSLGYLKSPAGTSFGYSSQQFALMPQTSKIVLWVENIEQYLELKKLIGDQDEIKPVLLHQ